MRRIYLHRRETFFFKRASITKASRCCRHLSFTGHRYQAHKAVFSSNHLLRYYYHFHDILHDSALELLKHLAKSVPGTLRRQWAWHRARNAGGRIRRHIWCQVVRNLAIVIVVDYEMNPQRPSRKCVPLPPRVGDDAASDGFNGRLLSTPRMQFWFRIQL